VILNYQREKFPLVGPFLVAVAAVVAVGVVVVAHLFK